MLGTGARLWNKTGKQRANDRHTRTSGHRTVDETLRSDRARTSQERHLTARTAVPPAWTGTFSDGTGARYRCLAPGANRCRVGSARQRRKRSGFCRTYRRGGNAAAVPNTSAERNNDSRGCCPSPAHYAQVKDMTVVEPACQVPHSKYLPCDRGGRDLLFSPNSLGGTLFQPTAFRRSLGRASQAQNIDTAARIGSCMER